MRYFKIQIGLIGHYPEDKAYIIRANTGDEFHSYIEAEAKALRSKGSKGLTDNEISVMTSRAWRNRKKPLLLKYNIVRGQPMIYAIAMSPSNRNAYLHFMDMDD